jgi:hypothetical protein
VVLGFTTSGSFDGIMTSLKRMSKNNILSVLNSCGQTGVEALQSATPVDTGLAAGSWSYDVQAKGGSYSISWTNTDIESDFPVAIMLQYGYGTGTGGYVQGRDYINPAMKPIFDEIADKVWRAVTSA